MKSTYPKLLERGLCAEVPPNTVSALAATGRGRLKLETIKKRTRWHKLYLKHKEEAPDLPATKISRLIAKAELNECGEQVFMPV